MSRQKPYPWTKEWDIPDKTKGMLTAIAVDIEQEWRWYLNNKPNAVLEDALSVPTYGIFWNHPATYEGPERTKIIRELTDSQYVQYVWIHLLPHLPRVTLQKGYWQ